MPTRQGAKDERTTTEAAMRRRRLAGTCGNWAPSSLSKSACVWRVARRGPLCAQIAGHRALGVLGQHQP